MKVSYSPKGYHSVIPSLAFTDPERAIAWYVDTFRARVKMILKNTDGEFVQAEITIGDSLIYISPEFQPYNNSPSVFQGNSVNLCLYLRNVDQVIKRAVYNGARLILPAEDQYLGDRSGRIEDPFGYVWIISTHIRDLSEAEIHRNMEELERDEDLYFAATDGSSLRYHVDDNVF